MAKICFSSFCFIITLFCWEILIRPTYSSTVITSILPVVNISRNVYERQVKKMPEDDRFMFSLLVLLYYRYILNFLVFF